MNENEWEWEYYLWIVRVLFMYMFGNFGDFCGLVVVELKMIYVYIKEWSFFKV